jgi:hypothetical protein
LLNGGARIVNGDLRKFSEQYGDVIQWESNRSYILTHGVAALSGVTFPIHCPIQCMMSTRNTGEMSTSRSDLCR